MEPSDLKTRIAGGLLSFPVTPFTAGGTAVDLDRYQGHIAWLSRYPAAALFAAGGTGEFFSLRLPEVVACVRAAKAAAGDVPIIAGCGYGAEKEQSAKFRGEADIIAERLRRDGMPKFAETYALGPTRVQLQNKDPRGWWEFADQLAQHSAEGSANTQQGVQKERPSIFDLEEGMKKITVPTLIVTGDEDWPCLIPNIFMKRAIPSAALFVMPNTGHTLNLEEPDLFNRAIADFVAQVEAGRWPMRDPRATIESITGVK